jgi:hypothetical protein
MKIELEIPIPQLPPLVKKIVILLLLAGVVSGFTFSIMEVGDFFETNKEIIISDGLPSILQANLALRQFVGVLLCFAIILLGLLAIALVRKLFTA